MALVECARRVLATSRARGGFSAAALLLALDSEWLLNYFSADKALLEPALEFRFLLVDCCTLSYPALDWPEYQLLAFLSHEITPQFFQTLM